MYGAIVNTKPAFSGHVAVRNVVDMEFLVKESEVITGRPGRKFIICGADRITYRVQSNLSGYEVHRLDEAGNSMCAEHMLPEMISMHNLGEAMREGCLFTSLLPG